MTYRFAFAVVLIALGVGCSDAAAPNDQPEVAVRDNSFSPSTEAIAVGETVTWTWSGSQQHNVSWDAGSPTASATQSSGTYQRAFAQAGKYDYHCTIHGTPGAGMHGAVTVQ